MREYDVVDKAAQTDTYPSQFRMGVDVGGRLFVTSRDTLKKHPTSRLAMLVDSKPTYIQDGLPVLFIDCDPQFFNIILHFCRDGHRNIHSHLTLVSSDKAILKQNITARTLWQTLLFQANYLFSSWATKNYWKSEIKKIVTVRCCDYFSYGTVNTVTVYLNIYFLLLIYINNKM